MKQDDDYAYAACQPHAGMESFQPSTEVYISTSQNFPLRVVDQHRQEPATLAGTVLGSFASKFSTQSSG